MHAVAPGLLAKDVHLSLLVFSEFQDLVPDLRRIGVEVFDESGSSGRVLRRRIREVARQQRVDLVHSVLLQASMASQIALLGSGIPSLVTWANTPTRWSPGAPAAWKSHLVRAADAAVGAVARSRYHAVTPGVARSMRRELFVAPSRVRVAERGRDPALFVPLGAAERAAVRQRNGIDADDVWCVAVGRQDTQKGYPELVAAFGEAVSGEPRLRLSIAGREGTASAALAEAVTRSPAGDRIELLGHRDDVRSLVGAADIVVCASHREGAAGALIEAMAMARPIACVELDGLEGILDAANALVVPRAGLAGAIGALASDAELRDQLGAGGRRTFEDRFTLDAAVNAMYDTYRWAIS